MTKPYLIKKGRISRPEGDGRRLYEPGDIVQMSEEQLAATGAMLEPVHVASPPARTRKVRPKPAANLVETIANSDEADLVQAILEDEVDGPGRKSVVEAAEAKLIELEPET